MTVERIERLEERKKVKEGAAGTRRNKGGVVGHVEEICECRKKGKGKEGVAARMIFFGSFATHEGEGRLRRGRKRTVRSGMVEASGETLRTEIADKIELC